MIAFNLKNLGSAIAQEVRLKLVKAGIEQVLVAQAKRRMAAGGDSEFKYPDLWDPPFPARRRAGDQPLRDTGRGMQSLNGVAETRPNGVRLLLRGLLYLVYHQHGFSTKGPNFIALTNKAVVTHRKGADPKEEGLKSVQEWRREIEEPQLRGETVRYYDPDYIMAWDGVTVPKRPVHNTPREDLEEIRDAIAEAIGGRVIA